MHACSPQACSEPPDKEIDQAQGAIDAARAAGADQYAADEFTAATSALQQAHEAVDQRDYRQALSRAIDAYERAQDAAKLAADGKAKARSDAEMTVSTANAAALALDAKLKAADAAHVPARDLAESRRISKDAAVTLQKARANLKSGDYLRRDRDGEGARSADSRADTGRGCDAATARTAQDRPQALTGRRSNGRARRPLPTQFLNP